MVAAFYVDGKLLHHDALQLPDSHIIQQTQVRLEFYMITEIAFIQNERLEHLCSLVKCVGHSPTLPVGFWVGLVMCTPDHKSHEISTPQAVLHFRHGLAWQEAQCKFTTKMAPKFHCNCASLGTHPLLHCFTQLYAVWFMKIAVWRRQGKPALPALHKITNMPGPLCRGRK